jgi:hypothetical protein
MSIPLSRRIAQAALLVAAGATPLVAAGAASAAELAPHGSDLGAGISKLDGIHSDSTIKGEAHNVGQALGTTGSMLAGTAIPATADVAGIAAANMLPSTEEATQTLDNPASALTQATTHGSGPLADTLTKLGRVTPLGHLVPGAANRSVPTFGMPGGIGQHAPSLAQAPKLPSVSGVDQLVTPDMLANPLSATDRLAQRVPAASGLAGQLPSQQQLTGALPATTDHLTGALSAADLSSAPSTERLEAALPDTAGLVGAVPAAHGLTNDLSGVDQLTHTVPGDADLAHPADSLDAGHLTTLEGQATGATHRLSSLPDLSNVTTALSGVAGALHHLPSVG